MIRKTLSYLILPVIALATLLVRAEPAAAQHGGSHGGGGFHGGVYHGGAYRYGYQSNYRARDRGYGHRPYLGYGFYPYDFGYYPFDTGYWPDPYSGADPSAGFYPADDSGPQPQTVELSGESPAGLTLEFPAPAQVWVDGAKLEGEPRTVRTVHSPVLRQGDRYTFHVKAEWTANRQTYEYHRDVPVEAGAQSHLLVVSGTAVGGK